MTWICRASLDRIAKEGFSSKARRALCGGKGILPFRIPYTRAEMNLARASEPPRMSISGVQDKVQLRLAQGRLELVDSGGDFLLKPIPSTPIFRAEAVPANEHFCMQVAAQIFRIETPPNALVLLADDEPAYLVRRYDRGASTIDGRLHQEDLAQVMARSSDDKNWKYNGSYEEMAGGIRIACPAAVVALERLWQRIVFCYAIGNGDAHWKNFSVLEDPLGGYRLAPAYDLLSTSLHFPIESPLALDLFRGGELTASFEELGFWTGADFLELSRKWGLVPSRSIAWLNRFALVAAQVESLARRSFLPVDLQEQFLSIWTDRVRAIDVR